LGDVLRVGFREARAAAPALHHRTVQMKQPPPAFVVVELYPLQQRGGDRRFGLFWLAAALHLGTFRRAHGPTLYVGGRPQATFCGGEVTGFNLCCFNVLRRLAEVFVANEKKSCKTPALNFAEEGDGPKEPRKQPPHLTKGEKCHEVIHHPLPRLLLRSPP